MNTTHESLVHLSDVLQKAPSIHAKIAILNASPIVREYLQKHPYLGALLNDFPIEGEAVLKQLIAIGQMDRFMQKETIQTTSFRDFLSKMMEVDRFYHELGGIVGYQKKILELLEKEGDLRGQEELVFHAPNFRDITEETEEVLEAIEWGIRSLPLMAEMYPMGGAADRLHLVDEITGRELPAAKLSFAGRTLFEELIRDLQAREFLYFKLFGTQIEIPLAIMTSQEKDNHSHILRICEQYRWFGRHPERFCFFTQPLVPTVDPKGNWCVLGPFSPLLKPGGHGAIWKLAKDAGVFDWFKKFSCKKALIRQINNPIASLDYGLLAFTGIGVKEKKIFGFASCPRLVFAAEGINVLIEKKNGEKVLTNIEYCDFQKYGIEDCPLKEGEPYSRFSSNTNILFADLSTLEKAIKKLPFPGLLINLKKITYADHFGQKKQGLTARLESTMQNIADVFSEKKKPIRTFVTYNHRHKTISTAKKAYLPGGPIQETPEECFYVQMQSARELLEKYCSFLLPEQRTLEEYLEKGPDFTFLYHPALGPLYSLIAQKLHRGKISLGSEMQLDLADLELVNLQLEGSLCILAKQPIGHFEKDGFLRYSDQTGRCVLKNVSVKNEGISWEESHPFWKNQFKRKGSLEIHLHGFSEFVAENISFHGSYRFDVPDGVRFRILEKDGMISIQKEALTLSPFWTYRWDKRRGVLAARE